MFSDVSQKQIKQSLVVGLLAGILAGMFGVGGGFLMVPLYVLWMGLDQRRSHATSLAAALCPPLRSPDADGKPFQNGPG